MIRKTEYNAIDFTKYRKRISTAFQNGDYAEKDFLDITSNKRWFALVYGDYEAVMPVAYTVHLGFRFVMMPKFCHYLGIFSDHDDIQLNRAFYQYLVGHFVVMHYAFNPHNTLNINLPKGCSYIIPSGNYEKVKKNYHSGRRRNIRTTETFLNTFQILDNRFGEEDKCFLIKYMKGIKKRKQKNQYIALAEQLFRAGILTTVAISSENGLQSLGCFYDGSRSSYLGIFVNRPELPDRNIPSVLIDRKIQLCIEKVNFDFAGSRVKNVADFNSRFGAEAYYYPYILRNKKEVIHILLKNLAKQVKIV